MKKPILIAILFCAFFWIAGCQETDETLESPDQPVNDSEYKEEMVQGSFWVDIHLHQLDSVAEEPAFSFRRIEEDLSLDKDLLKSLIESNFTDENILSESTEITIDRPQLTLTFANSDYLYLISERKNYI